MDFIFLLNLLPSYSLHSQGEYTNKKDRKRSRTVLSYMSTTLVTKSESFEHTYFFRKSEKFTGKILSVVILSKKFYPKTYWTYFKLLFIQKAITQKFTKHRLEKYVVLFYKVRSNKPHQYNNNLQLQSEV